MPPRRLRTEGKGADAVFALPHINISDCLHFWSSDQAMEDIMNVMKGPEMTLPSEGKMAFIQRENEIGKKKNQQR